MTSIGFMQILLYLVILLALVQPLGWYMAQVYQGQRCGLEFICKPIEKLIYRCCHIDPYYEMSWKSYLTSILFFNFWGVIAVYLMQRCQFFLPLNPQQFPSVPPDLAFNTAVSFVTNTNWQAYGGESTMSYLTQMSALTVQNFLSAATGMSVLIALIRGICRRETTYLGNFWVDTVRGTLYILLPLALLFSVLLVSQGVIQNFKPYQTVTLNQPVHYQDQMKTVTVTQQTIPMGPAASQIAIKQLGTNGGGFFNVNSAHPFENPHTIQ